MLATLLGNVLDALDDLYDQRERSVWWTERLLTATAVALKGTSWEEPMTIVAHALRPLRFGQDPAEANRLALIATDDLRLLVARAV
jgi:hypothetical protein